MEDARVVGERLRQRMRERREHQGEDDADGDRPADHAHGGRVRAVGVPGSEHPADDHLAGDRDCVQDERDEEEQLVADLMCADLRVSHAREERGGEEEGGVERDGADEDLPPDPEQRLHRVPAGPSGRRVRPQQLDDEGCGHPGLRDRRSGRRAGDSPVEDVDEEHLEHEVGDVRDDDDLERPAQVRDAAEVALAGEGDQRGRQAERCDPEVEERQVAGVAVAAEAREERLGHDLADDEQSGPDPERRPERLRREPCGLVLPARARRARDDRRRPVREEVEDRECAREDGAGEAERRDLRPAEMTDDRGVGEDVQRLGRQRAERRQREPDDLAIVRGTKTHRAADDNGADGFRAQPALPGAVQPDPAGVPGARRPRGARRPVLVAARQPHDDRQRVPCRALGVGRRCDRAEPPLGDRSRARLDDRDPFGDGAAPAPRAARLLGLLGRPVRERRAAGPDRRAGAGRRADAEDARAQGGVGDARRDGIRAPRLRHRAGDSC